MKTIITIILLALFSPSIFSQNQFQEFLDRVNSLPDSSAKAAVIDSFITVARAEGIPFIENNTANFIYLGSVNSVNVPGDFNGWNQNSASMVNLVLTNFWYHSKDFEMNARLDYKFVLNDSSWILDPENPNTVSGGFGPNSELAMPEYVQPWEIVYNPSIDHGTIEDKSIFSTNLNATHQLKIYLPPGYNNASTYPAAYFQDGFEYVTLASAANVLDNLIDSNKIEPLIAVFVKPNNRNEEYAFSKRNEYRLFFVEELVPFIDSIYSTKVDPKERVVMGPSYGGNISALISYNHPDVFGLCGVHSGAFQPNNYEAFTLITTGVLKDIKWSSIWGSYEGGLSQTMQDFRDSLLSKGYELDWLELPEGHSWGLWRATIDNMLKYFSPSSATSIDINNLQMPEGFELCQNYPNPFNPSTTMSFTISDASSTNLKVYDILGNEIATLVDEEKSAGSYSVVFIAEQLSAGVYFYELKSGDFVKTKKMVLLK